MINTFIRKTKRGFPGGPVVRALWSIAGGMGSILGWGIKILKLHVVVKKKNKDLKSTA